MAAKKFPAMADVGMKSRLAGPARDQKFQLPSEILFLPGTRAILLSKIDHWSILLRRMNIIGAIFMKMAVFL